MFSPIMAIWEASASFTDNVSSLAHLSSMNASKSLAEVVSACAATSATYVWNFSFLATKSVSALTSTITAFFSSAATAVATMPSAAIRPAFLAAPASPFSLRNSTAFSISPSVAARAFLQSIIPAPVISLNSFTIAAVTAAISSSSNFKVLIKPQQPLSRKPGQESRFPLRPLKLRPALLR